MRRFVFLNSMQSICARLRRPARGKNSATKIKKQITVTRRGGPLLLACAVCLLLLPAADSQRPDDLTVHVHVIWTGNVTFNRSEGKNQVEENDQITITYDVTSHKTAPAGTPPWGIYPGTDNYQFTVSGGGSGTAHFQGSPKTYSASWTWHLADAPKDEQTVMELQPGSFQVSLPDLNRVKIDAPMQGPSQPKDLEGALVDTFGALSVGPKALLAVESLGIPSSMDDLDVYTRFGNQLKGTFDENSKAFSRSGSASLSRNKPQLGMTSSTQVTYSLNFNQQPEDVEAILIPDKHYQDWMPEAGSDEDTPGNGMLVKVELQKKDKPGEKPRAKAKSFKFELTGVSKEPGVCLNWPPKEKTKEKPDFDLKIDTDGNPSLQVASDGQSAKSGPDLQDSSVIVFSYDWGAWGSLKVTAELDNGQTVVAHRQNKSDVTELKIPKDDNNNHVADGYEIEGETSAADADDDPLPKGDHTGDTLSYYEEYRGFQVSGGHVRTDNNRKDVFVYDRDQIGVGYFPASGMNIHLLQRDEYTKVEVNDPLHENARVVNFNHDFAHLGDAHVVMMVNGVAPDEPGRLGETVGGPGPPKKIIAVYVDKWGCLGSKWGNLELQDNIAHELAHACNVQHHGERDYEPVDGSIWKRGPDGKWYPMGTPTRHDVAAQHGQHSGSMQCIMRYYRAAYYEHDGGRFRWKRPRGDTGTWTWVEGEAYGPTEVPGTLYCTSQDGDPTNPKTGPTAEDRGFCSEQFCVNDLKH